MSYQTALASTSSAELCGVADTVEDHDNIEDYMQKYVNAKCSEKWRFNSKYLRKIHIAVPGGKYKPTKCSLYLPFEDINDATMVAKLACHSQSFHRRDLRVSNYGEINRETEEVERKNTIQGESVERKIKHTAWSHMKVSTSRFTRDVTYKYAIHWQADRSQIRDGNRIQQLITFHRLSWLLHAKNHVPTQTRLPKSSHRDGKTKTSKLPSLHWCLKS